MNLFGTIRSLAALKKRYRELAIENHPDKGGDTEKMQLINAEFEKLFEVWKNDKTNSGSGYDEDYSGSTSKEYESYVYNEYRWRGENYKGQEKKEILDIIRGWLKDTYPRCKFSVTKEGYNSIAIRLVSADFEAIKKDARSQDHVSINHYFIERDDQITERAKEVMINVRNFANSYNYDNSDSMSDYYDVNFYLTLAVGKWDKPFKVVTPKLKSAKGDEPDEFKFKEGEYHKKMRLALGKQGFMEHTRRYYKSTKPPVTRKILGTIVVKNDKSIDFSPLWYSAPKTAQKRIDKLLDAGIKSHYDGASIVFDGYEDWLRDKLDEEIQENLKAKEAFDAKKKKGVRV